MRESENNGILEKELKEKLNWYTMHASEEKFDEKAVESILYLLDHTTPLEENNTPTPDEAWERFQTIVENGQELLPLTKDKLPQNPYDPDEKKQDKKPGKFKKFICRHKIFAAAALLVLILAVSGTIQAGAKAIQNNGFFFWMKRDDTGVQMMTSPENLDVDTDNAKRKIYQSKDDLPDWTQEWLEIEAEFEMPDNYEWQYFEIGEFENRRGVNCHYLNTCLEKKVILGVWIFLDKTMYHEEGFIDYSYVESYKMEQNLVYVYSRMEETGRNYYMICFYEDNCQYFIQGQDDLNELKLFVEQYLNCVKSVTNNL